MENQTVVRGNKQRIEGLFANRRNRWVIGATALMVLLTGLWAAHQSGKACDLQMRDKLLSRVTDVAAAISVLDVKNLSFTADDKEQARFQRICAQMRAYVEVSGPGRLYIIGLRDGQIVSGPESSIGNHQSASMPGTVYENPDQQNFDVFEKGQSQVWESLKDKNRTHVTALVPITAPYAESVLAAVGMDIEAAEWQAAVLRAQAAPFWVTFSLLVVLLLINLILEYFFRHSAQRNERRRQAEPILCLAFALLLTLVLTVYVDQMERVERQHTFNLQAHAEVVAVAAKIYDLRGMLQELAYYFETTEKGVTREEFRSYFSVMGGKNLVESVGWIPAVPDKEVKSFVEEVRASGVPDFSIWQRDKEGGMEPVAPRPVYYPVLYIEPSFRNRAMGYDLNSEPKRSAAVQEALSTGLATASDLLQFVTDTNLPNGFFVFLPVNARVQKGLLTVTIRPQFLLASSARKNRDMAVCLFQLKLGQEPLFMAGSSDSCGLSCWDDKDSGLSLTVPVFRFGKAYVFRVIPDPDWLEKHPLQNGRIVCGIGLLLTLLISSLTALITNRRVVLEEMVECRTAELKLAQENMAYLNQQNELILISAAEGILGLDLQGNHRFVNPSALKMLGYEIEELIGRPSHSLWHHTKPDGTRYPREECPILTASRDGTSSHVTDEIFWRKDGTSFPVEYNSGPVYEYGLVAGSVVTFTDITERKNREEEIKKTMGLLEVTLEAMADGLLVVDDTGKILRYNKKFTEMWKIPAEIVASGSDEATLNFVLGQLRQPEQFLTKVQALYQHPEEKSFEVLHFRDGRVFERYSQAQRISDGLYVRVWSFHDATKREQAEALLWASQTKLDLALQSALMGVWQWDVVKDKRTFDRQACSLMGISPATFSGTAEELFAVVCPDDRQRVKDALTRTIEQHIPYDVEYRVIWPDGSIHHIAARAHLFLDDGDQQLKVTGVCWDITDRRKAEERMRLLAKHLQTVREEERKRIARELHDDIGQILTAIKIDLVGVQTDCRCEGNARNKIADIQQLLLAGIQSVHTLCRQLRPGALDDLDLSDAIEGLMEDWKVRNQVECTLCSDVDDEMLSDEIKTAIFRMVQEALTNVSRYAQASEVEIDLVADEQAVNVTITDNGRGMEPGAADKPTSFGLMGMRERIETLGGTLCIESAPGKGVRIEGTIPLSRKG